MGKKASSAKKVPAPRVPGRAASTPGDTATAGDESPIGRILAEKDRFRPASGYNVVGVDDFEPPGEALYLIAHFETRAEAEAALKRRKVEVPNEAAYIYSFDDA